MKKRQVIILLGALILVAGFLGMKGLQSLKKSPARSAFTGNYPVVTVLDVQNTTVPNVIEFTGRVTALNKVELYAEVTGAVLQSDKTFREGVRYSEGEIMLRIDSIEFYNNLQAARSGFLNLMLQVVADVKFDFPADYDLLDRYAAQIDLNKPLPELPSTKDKLRNFLASRDVYNRFYAIRSQENRLSKYNIKAPFDGSLMEGYMPAGSMVRQGQKLGTLIQAGASEIEASVSAADAALIQTGDAVVMQDGNTSTAYRGTVQRKGQFIDPGTQSYSIYINARSEDLREGMYLSGKIFSGAIENAFVVNRSLLLSENSMYAIVDSTLQPISVDVLKVGEKQVTIKGIPDGTILLNQVLSNAYKGLKVSPKK
jgi:multidrug efflux pump subunit AcrA (membrane-fusion protein)